MIVVRNAFIVHRVIDHRANQATVRIRHDIMPPCGQQMRRLCPRVLYSMAAIYACTPADHSQQSPHRPKSNVSLSLPLSRSLLFSVCVRVCLLFSRLPRVSVGGMASYFSTTFSTLLGLGRLLSTGDEVSLLASDGIFSSTDALVVYPSPIHNSPAVQVGEAPQGETVERLLGKARP